MGVDDSHSSVSAAIAFGGRRSLTKLPKAKMHMSGATISANINNSLNLGGNSMLDINGKLSNSKGRQDLSSKFMTTIDHVKDRSSMTPVGKLQIERP